MIIEEMEGKQREILADAVDYLLRNSKAAVGTLTGAYIPTTHATDQVEKLERLKSAIPAYDDADRDVEIIQPLLGVCQNAIIVYARGIDKTTRANEIAKKVSTRESDAKIAELQKILKLLGDERILEDEIKSPKRSSSEPTVDPLQTDFTTQQNGTESEHAASVAEG